VAEHRGPAVVVLGRLLDDAFAADGSVNLAETIANPYLSTIVGDLIGLPEEDRQLVKDGATAGSLAMAGDFSPDVIASATAFADYFRGFVTARGQALARGECPAGTFSNTIFGTCPTGYEPTFDERVTYETLLATGGNETTAQLLSNLVILLAEQPEILHRLRAEPQLRPAAVEEVLRYISPVTGLFRHTTRAVGVPGADREIPGGAKVLLMYGSGNHDEAHYDRPDEFVIDRFPRGFADSDHLSFTTGIHVCLGAHLARMMIEVFLDRFATRVDSITITGPVVRSHNALVRVIDDLPVRLQPSGG
jgi:cytochrome P450